VNKAKGESSADGPPLAFIAPALGAVTK